MCRNDNTIAKLQTIFFFINGYQGCPIYDLNIIVKGEGFLLEHFARIK